MTELKKGDKIKMPATRFEKTHLDQEFDGVQYKDKRLVPISAEDVLTYVEANNGRVVFEMVDGRRIFIDETLFDVENYIVI